MCKTGGVTLEFGSFHSNLVNFKKHSYQTKFDKDRGIALLAYHRRKAKIQVFEVVFKLELEKMAISAFKIFTFGTMVALQATQIGLLLCFYREWRKLLSQINDQINPAPGG